MTTLFRQFKTKVDIGCIGTEGYSIFDSLFNPISAPLWRVRNALKPYYKLALNKKLRSLNTIFLEDIPTEPSVSAFKFK